MRWLLLLALAACRTEPLPSGSEPVETPTPVDLSTPIDLATFARPGTICGTLSCTGTRSTCCSSAPNEAGICIAPDDPCSQWKFTCDDPSDCGPGQVCCLYTLGSDGAICETPDKCKAMPGLERCTLPGDCRNGQTCLFQQFFSVCG
jgi:hypothetical protein